MHISWKDPDQAAVSILKYAWENIRELLKQEDIEQEKERNGATLSHRRTSLGETNVRSKPKSALKSPANDSTFIPSDEAMASSGSRIQAESSNSSRPSD